MAEKRLYKDLRLKAKAANQRMRELEKRDITSPAYQAIQAKLEVLGKSASGAKGRRFSETGRATYNEMEILTKILDEFLGQKTSTVKGAKNYYNNVWESANENNQLSSAGISKDDWFNFFENMPSSKKDRMFYSIQVKLFKAYMRKNNKLTDENKMTPQEIAEAIQESKTMKEAYTKLGLSLKEVIKENA